MSELKVEIKIETVLVQISFTNSVTVNGKTELKEPQFVTNIPYDIFVKMIDSYNNI